jgi:YidC/Oxa1 family membrane protein insertase
MNPLEPFETAIGWLLSVFYQYVPNLGFAIILLTCVVMAILLPLTAKQTRSMIAMQRIQPEIKKIQQQYKDDRQKQNEELMKFYQENNVNPLSGCLPLIIQMPVLFSLFRVLRSIQDHIPTTGQFDRLFTDLCPSAASAGACHPNAADVPSGMHFLGMNLLVSPADSGSVTSSIIGRLPYFIAVAIVVATGWYQMWQTQLRQKRLGSNQSSPINKQMQMLSRVFPIFFGFFAWIASSGLVLYFVTSSLWRIGQQHLVLNKYYDEQAHAKGGGKSAARPKAIDAESEPSAKATPPSGKGGEPGGASGNGATSGNPPKRAGANGNGSQPKKQVSRHTSAKKRKRRR